jgi:hypothetical protein
MPLALVGEALMNPGKLHGGTIDNALPLHRFSAAMDGAIEMHQLGLPRIVAPYWPNSPGDAA